MTRLVTSHTGRDVEALRARVTTMGRKVEDMIEQGIRAIVTRDAQLAEAAIVADDDVNAMECEIDATCVRILARRQPLATDLRVVGMTLKLVSDLERIGDLAVNVAERAVELSEGPDILFGVDLPTMAAEVRGMIRSAVDAFGKGDADLAQTVIEHDAIVDRAYDAAYTRVLGAMSVPAHVYRATRVQSIAKYLERAADHAASAAEIVVFMVRGEDVRHSGSGRYLSRPPPAIRTARG
jgi:phosphate transport system protein